MNLPNKLTILRIILTFVFMLLIFSSGIIYKILALIVFILAALTDWFDGKIAKSRNLITDFGKIMDPIADKVLVLAAFLSFIQLQLVSAWMVMVIIVRELVVTSLRIFALSKGKVIAASKSGKHKTVSQMLAIFIILVSIIFKEAMQNLVFWHPLFERAISSINYVAMLTTTALTIISGTSFIWRNRKLIRIY